MLTVGYAVAEYCAGQCSLPRNFHSVHASKGDNRAHLVDVGDVSILDDGRDEAAIGHGHCQCDIDALVVGDAIAVSRARCTAQKEHRSGLQQVACVSCCRTSYAPVYPSPTAQCHEVVVCAMAGKIRQLPCYLSHDANNVLKQSDWEEGGLQQCPKTDRK